MTDKEVLDFHVLQRKRFNLIQDLLQNTQQMDDNLNRGDEYGFALMMDMRQESLDNLLVIRHHTIEKLEELYYEDRRHMKHLLAGENARNPVEIALCKQVKETEELWKKLEVLDKRVGKRAFPQDKKKPAVSAE